MRPILVSFLASLALLAACSGGGAGNNTSAQAPAPKPTGPAPKTPVTDITPAAGNSASWMAARDGSDAPRSAPYGDVLDQPVVNAAGAAD